MKKLLLIVNPCSGKKRIHRSLIEIVELLNRGGRNVSVFITEKRGDATQIAAQRAEEFDMLVCAGGDGTFNELISGLQLSGVSRPVGYIPAGSTNDFANSLRLAKDFKQATLDLIYGNPTYLDLGRFNNRYFTYIASFGIFTRTSYATSQSLKNVLGHFAYLLSSVKELTSLRSYHLRFTLSDGQVFEDDYIFGAVSNTTSVAGVLTLSPELVDMSDGKFELLLVRKPRTALELSDCVLSLTTQKYDTPMLTLVSTTRVEVEGSQNISWSLDGEEAPGADICVIENLHHAAQVMVNLNRIKKLEK